MSVKQENQQGSNIEQKIFQRKQEDLLLKQQLLIGPDTFITERASDESLDKLFLKVKLIGGDEFVLSDYVSTLIAIYDSKFSKEWFYRLADIYGDDRAIMNNWVKPDYVRETIVQFVYGRFPYSVIRMLRKNKRKFGTSDNKLYHLLTYKASNDLDIVIKEVFDLMGKSVKNNPLAFKMAYSSMYRVYFQTQINF